MRSIARHIVMSDVLASALHMPGGKPPTVADLFAECRDAALSSYDEIYDAILKALAYDHSAAHCAQGLLVRHGRELKSGHTLRLKETIRPKPGMRYDADASRIQAAKRWKVASSSAATGKY